MVVMKRGVSTTLTAVYWVLLPFSALSAVSLAFFQFSPAVTRSGAMPFWALPLTVVMTLLIIWRLWTHDRARRAADTAAATEPDAGPAAESESKRA